MYSSRLFCYRPERGEIEIVALIHRICISLRCLKGVDAPDALHLRLNPLPLPFAQNQLLLPVAQLGRFERRLHGFEEMPATEGGGGAAVVLGRLPRAIVGVFDPFSVAWAAQGFGAEGIRYRGAHVVNHLLRDHPGVCGTPVPMLLIRLVEPFDAVQDDGLHFHPSGAVGVPDGFDPEVDVDVLAISVDVGIAGDGRGWEFEVIGLGPLPFLGQRTGPSLHEEIDGDGVFD